jgi:hypothetical protein
MTAVNALISTLQNRMKTITAIPTTTPVIETPVITTPTIITTTVTTTTTPPAPDGLTNQQISDYIDFLTANVTNMATEISALQDQIVTMQSSMASNATNIGTSSISVNGLNVLFITNNIDVGATGGSTSGSAQFAIKITNNTPVTISNMDITGQILSSSVIAGLMANNFPQITDASGLCSIAYSNTATDTISFEAYGSKGSLTIPAGGSITLRPKISVLALANGRIPPTTFTISLKAVTYDLPVPTTTK